MSPAVKILIGFVAVMVMGWAYHGPLGQGEAFVGALEAQAQQAVAEVPGVQARLGHDPLTRAATLSGPANTFQREGMGDFPGLNDRVGAAEGISSIRWADSGEAKPAVPLLAEALAFILLAYLIGLALGRLLFGRPKREGYL